MSRCAMTVMVVLGCILAGCGGSGDTGTATGSSTLTIYSSLPLQGPSREESLSVINGEKLALEQVGGIVGKYTVKYVSLDDAKSATGGWDPGVALTNARTAVQDKSTIAYLGDFDSGASAVSIPLLNEAAILQISPSNSSVGLTQVEGAGKGEPEKYYPSSKRTFGRVVPADQVQARAQVALQQGQGCTSTYIADDRQIDGEAIAHRIESAADQAGFKVVGGSGVDENLDSYRSLAKNVAESGADCLFFGGNTPATGAALFNTVNSMLPTVKLFGSAGLYALAFSSGLQPAAQKLTYVTSPALARKLYPPAGKRFLSDYVSKYHVQPEAYAIYGYEAMKVALASIAAAGNKGNDRQAVTSAFFRIRDRRSALGTYSIDRNGDTTLSEYGSYRVAGGKLVFDKVFKTA